MGYTDAVEHLEPAPDELGRPHYIDAKDVARLTRQVYDDMTKVYQAAAEYADLHAGPVLGLLGPGKMPTGPQAGAVYVLGDPTPQGAPDRHDGTPAQPGDGVTWTGSAWVNLGTLRGPAGPQGASVTMRGVVASSWPVAPMPGDLYILGAPMPPGAPIRPDGKAAQPGDGVVWTGGAWINGGPLQGPQGPKGDQGATGPRGDPGLPGPKGDRGDPGARGLEGPQGAPGPVGPGIRLLSSVPTAADLPTTGNQDGDARLTIDTGNLHVWASDNRWHDIAHVQGPQGVPGLQGVKGDQGEKGDPGAAGAKGDRGDPGPIGPEGPQGDQGIPGPQGLQGIPGPEGPRGLAGSQGPKGDKGDKGDPGAGVPASSAQDAGAVLTVSPAGAPVWQALAGDTDMVYRGDWMPGDAYAVGDTVRDGDGLWVCVTPVLAGSTTPLAAPSWEKVAGTGGGGGLPLLVHADIKPWTAGQAYNYGEVVSVPGDPQWDPPGSTRLYVCGFDGVTTNPRTDVTRWYPVSSDLMAMDVSSAIQKSSATALALNYPLGFANPASSGRMVTQWDANAPSDADGGGWVFSGPNNAAVKGEIRLTFDQSGPAAWRALADRAVPVPAPGTDPAVWERVTAGTAGQVWGRDAVGARWVDAPSGLPSAGGPLTYTKKVSAGGAGTTGPGDWDAGLNYKQLWVARIDKNGTDGAAFWGGLKAGDTLTFTRPGGTAPESHTIKAITHDPAGGATLDEGWVIDVGEDLTVSSWPANGDLVVSAGASDGSVLTLTGGAPAWQALPTPPSGLPPTGATYHYAASVAAAVGPEGAFGTAPDGSTPDHPHVWFSAKSEAGQDMAPFWSKITAGSTLTWTLGGVARTDTVAAFRPKYGGYLADLGKAASDAIAAGARTASVPYGAADGDVLTLAGGKPAWQAPAGGGADPSEWLTRLYSSLRGTDDTSNPPSPPRVWESSGRYFTGDIIWHEASKSLWLCTVDRATIEPPAHPGLQNAEWTAVTLTQQSGNATALRLLPWIDLTDAAAQAGKVLTLDQYGRPQWAPAGPWVGTAAEYAALATKEPTRLYIVTGA